MAYTFELRFITEQSAIEFLLLGCYLRSCRTSGNCNLSSHDISGVVNCPEIHHALVNYPSKCHLN
ncbi:hypothetical protein BDQ94DRAFT_148443 [Aspergillus welwitschiae]|uniref:Uncharacterized protein n=1 Tax=Aspergillus welwitschiae TaxID=1341132 RepID=A0A3F3PUE7_9EURO|nr:hypothetical protein BDQ94DRAFT_148443 [Aspergillus welwitschiae]RDH30448.1 hypothetical protein BDQ94DRAFT_148443 [Aspergillus welwitschiae]